MAVEEEQFVGRGGLRALARLLSVLLVCLFILAGIPATGLPEPSDPTVDVYRVHLLDGDVREILEASNVPIDMDYGAFGLVAMSVAQRDLLEARGVAVTPEDLHGIHIDGFQFDTREGEPYVPANLRATMRSQADLTSVLVQFEGPILPDWRHSLETVGATIIDYVSSNAFLVRAPAALADAVAGLPHVQWTGAYHPAYKIEPSLADIEGASPVTVITFPGETTAETTVKLDPASVIRVHEGARFSTVEALATREQIETMARLSSVYYIEPRHDVAATTSRAQAVMQTGLAPTAWGARKLWDAGLDGTGQLVAVADSGVDYDHRFFRESPTQIVNGDIYNVTDLSRRKLVRYFVMSGYSGVDPLTDPWAWKDSRRNLVTGNVTSGHGTGTSGILLGNDDGIGTSDDDGIAKGAKFIFEDIGTVCRNPGHFNWWDDCLSYIPPDYEDLFGPPYLEGAKIHSDSWGAVNSNYDLKARMVDAWMWNNTDAFVVFSNGNGGPCSVGSKHNTGSPASAKSVFSSGMSHTYPNENDMDCGSSPGPTADQRRKPTAVAVGEGVTARSSGDPFDNETPGRQAGFGGTSYSAPVHAGLATIVRQYFMDGWYPAGEPVPADAFEPSGALLKAMLVAGSREMTGADRDMVGESIFPNNSQGWGRVLLDDVIYLRGESRTIEVRDVSTGIPTGGGLDTINVDVVNADEPLRIVLAWSDQPGGVFANPAIVNNLNLVATAPDGKEYKGNVFYGFSESNPGESKPDAGVYDVLNTVEGIIVKTPATGQWTISVFGGNVPSGPQPYALVVTGGLGPYPAVSIEPPTDLRADLGGLGLAGVQLNWTVSADDPFIVDHYAVYVSTAYDPARSNHTYLAEVPAGTTGYVHAGAGLGDPRQLFYFIQANTSLGVTARSLDEAAKFVRPLPAGMSLVSVPIELTDWSTESVLRSVAAKYEAAWSFTPGAVRPWRGSWDAKNATMLSSVDRSTGLWLKMREPGDFVVAGLVPTTTDIALFAGWNLVGYPSFIVRTVADALAGISFVRVEGYDPSAVPYHLRTWDSSDTMQAGEAFWIRVANPGIWTVAN